MQSRWINYGWRAVQFSLCRPVHIHQPLLTQERRGQAVNRQENQRMLSEGGDGGTSPMWAKRDHDNKMNVDIDDKLLNMYIG